MAIKIDKEVETQMKAHAVQSYPEECCGFLYSRLDTDERIIVEHQPVTNREETENKQRNYIISSDDYMEAEKYAEENQLSLAGIYHSHPDHPAIPSQKDLKRAMPFFTYLILSVKGGDNEELKAWTLNNEGKFDEETVEIVFETPKESIKSNLK